MKGGQSETEDRAGKEKNHGSNPAIRGLVSLVFGQTQVRVL